MTDGLPLGNPLRELLCKEPKDYTRADMLRATLEWGVERLTFRYTGLDCRLKELVLPFGDLKHAESILAAGERVDGSSLFKGLVDVASSDLYVVPAYRSAFVNPFDDKSLDFICRFLDRDGELARFTPDNILHRAHERLKAETGLELHAAGELEFFLLYEAADERYVPRGQTGYHASAPFFRCGEIVNEMTRCLERVSGAVKYSHAEAGFINRVCSERPELHGRRAEQFEIELLPRPIEEMGDLIALSRWLIRSVAQSHGLLATFAPKLEEGVPGNGLHIHLELCRDGENAMRDEAGGLTREALQLIGGLLRYAPTLTAFGSTVASAFFRLVPNQEAPTRVCWSECDRSALVRVPLGWRNGRDLAGVVNVQEGECYSDTSCRQTVELRSPDGSAHFQLLLAGLCTAASWGLSSDEAVAVAQSARVQRNRSRRTAIGCPEPLPGSCAAAAQLLLEDRRLYEENGDFPPQVIDHLCGVLAGEEDDSLDQELAQIAAEDRAAAVRRIMHKDIHIH